MSFSDFEYAGKRKQTRRERFLAEMDQVVPWSGLLGLIEPYCPKAGGGRQPYRVWASDACNAGNWAESLTKQCRRAFLRVAT